MISLVTYEENYMEVALLYKPAGSERWELEPSCFSEPFYVRSQTEVYTMIEYIINPKVYENRKGGR
ncbi:hypothetical protein [Thalassobacillus sp. C254]|uniref:hypothetical protein n=1 Tax=Thalassobacillus sp. C254 TaxID=1225341 RepID=UPI0006D0B034|nr:hypothetical protein [Thalassobacillus sp. C254]